MTTKAYFFMKDKFIFSNKPVLFLSAFFFLIILDSCAPSKPSLKKLSITEPEKVVSKQDSLLALSKERRPEFVSILSTAHINIARKAESSGNRETAIKEYKKVLAIDPMNKTARYELLMLEGLSLYKKGSKSSLWDAIEFFSKASMVDQEDGLASYWIAKSYEKKDNKDYDLIIEAYEDSLSKTLPEGLREEAEASKDAAYRKKKTFDNFWK
jgi:tetratricopeptide (TPR) repeat protein